MIVFHERSLRQILTSYFDYYHRSRTPLDLGQGQSLERFPNGVYVIAWFERTIGTLAIALIGHRETSLESYRRRSIHSLGNSAIRSCRA